MDFLDLKVDIIYVDTNTYYDTRPINEMDTTKDPDSIENTESSEYNFASNIMDNEKREKTNIKDRYRSIYLDRRNIGELVSLSFNNRTRNKYACVVKLVHNL